jgi:hypothetical protein
MPPRKAAPAPKFLPTKESFFLSKRTMVEAKKAVEPPMPTKPVEAKPRRFLYETGTDVAYAEVVGNTAISLDTGEELFSFGGVREEYQASGFQRRFDFTPPDGKRHPGDKFVDVLNLVKAGILTKEDVATQRAFTDEELMRAMERLEAYRREMERRCCD